MLGLQEEMWDSGTKGKRSSWDHSPLSPRSSPAGRLRYLSGDRDSSRGLLAQGRHKDPGTSQLPSTVLPPNPRRLHGEHGPSSIGDISRVPSVRVQHGQAEDRSCQRSPSHGRGRHGPRETQRCGGQRSGGATAIKPSGTPCSRPTGDGTGPSPHLGPGRTPRT